MRVYKPTYSKPLPEKAKIFSRKGKRFAKFKDAKGHTAEARLTKAGDKILCETEHWHIEFEDNQQIRRHLKAFTNEQATKRLADRIQQLLNCKANNLTPDTGLQKFIEQIPATIRDELISFGLLDGAAAIRTLAEQIEIFRNHLIKKERNPRYIKGIIRTLLNLFASCGFKSWSDITADSLKARLDELRDGGAGISKRTYNGKLKAAKHFCHWQAKQLKTTSPIDFIEGLDNEGTDRRHERRAATPDEIRRLLEVTAAEPEHYGMSGRERSLLYRFAVETGFRAGEISTLTTGCFDFDNLTVTVRAGYSKHRREDVQAIRPELAAMLKEHCRGKLPTAKVFGGSFKQLTNKAAEMLKLDLEAAEIPYIENDRVFDFHAFRHTFVTSLRNVSSRTAQALARHQSSAMTDRYTHIALHDERAALDALPDYGAPSEESQKATGTDDKILLKSCFQDAHTRSQAESGGQKTALVTQKTPLGADNKGAEHIGSLLPKRKNPQNNAKNGDNPKSEKNLASSLFFNQKIDAHLEKIIRAWPNLSIELRRAIVRMVE